MFSQQIQMIRSGFYFDDLKVLQAAIDKRGRLPDDYFYTLNHDCVFVDKGWLPKTELKAIRKDIVNEIIAVIKDQNKLPYSKKMLADHYARLFHALAILKVDKDELHETCNDYMRNAFLQLWKLDDGGEEIWKIIGTAAWFISEAEKGIMGKPVRETIYPEE